jgi:hypothetical protein
VSSADAAHAEGAPAVPAPSRSQSMQLQWRRLQRSVALPVTMAAVAALILGVLLGRATAPTGDVSGLSVVGREVVTLAVDADALWTGGRSDLPAVGEQLHELRVNGDPASVTPHVASWLEAYDRVLVRLVGVDVPPAARPVQRQFVTAVALTRDAVEVLASAAAIDDPATRRELTSEALRLRIRAEEVTQTAQASLRDLQGGVTSGVSEPRRLPSLADLR